jgi:hypothetical protein
LKLEIILLWNVAQIKYTRPACTNHNSAKNSGHEYNNVYKYCLIYLKELFVSITLTCYGQYMV